MSAVARQANYAWRLFGTGSAFLLFSLGGALMSVTVFPLINLAVPNDISRVSLTRRVIRGSFRLFVGFLIGMGIIRFSVRGSERLRELNGAMVIANHPSLLDVVLLMSLMPEAQCVVKSRLWRNPFLGGVVRAAGYVRNDGDPEALLDDCVDALNGGQNLVIFPEGSRSVPGEKPNLKRGFAHVALRAEADIVPIAISCKPTTLTKGEPWYAIPERRIVYQFEVLEPIEIRAYANLDVPTIAARRLCQDVDRIFERELGYERPGA